MSKTAVGVDEPSYLIIDELAECVEHLTMELESRTYPEYKVVRMGYEMLEKFEAKYGKKFGRGSN